MDVQKARKGGVQEMDAETQLTPAQQELVAIWEEHMRREFETRSVEDTMRTMVEDAHVVLCAEPSLHEMYSA